MQPAKLRPAKVRNALSRRWFERRLERTPLHPAAGVVELGSAYGGWRVPGELIEPSWLCYCVGLGGDISFDIELIRRYGVTVRAFDPVSDYVDAAVAQAAQEPRFSAHRAAIATRDGPLRVQLTHDPTSHSVSAASLYESSAFVEMPGRTLTSLMSQLGDSRIDLLKLDIEGAEYDVLPTIDLRALGVKVFATQLHHNGSVRGATALIERLREHGYVPVACRPAVKLTFVQGELV
jgi:FkbM family methyltransferase